MRAFLGLFILGLIAGDGLIAALVGAKLIFYKDQRGRRSATIVYLGLLFLAIAVHLLLFLVALGELPKPQPDMPNPRPLSFRLYILAALSVLALGVWPAALHFLGLGKKR